MTRGRLSFFVTSVIILGGFFVFASQIWAAESDAQITEIMYDPSGSDTKNEWLEIKNMGAAPLEIIGGAGALSWRLFDGSNHTFSTSTVLASQEYCAVVQDEATFLSNYSSFAGQILKSAFSLGNTSGTVALRIGSDGTMWSEVGYNSGWGASGNGKTLEKKSEGGDNIADNWQESFVAGGTPGALRSEAPATPPPPTPPATTTTLQILINEIYSIITTSSEKEWVEIFNPNATAVDLSIYTLHDNSSTTTLSGTISAQGFFIVEFSNRLNNDGDIVVIKDLSGVIIDQVSFGNYNDGDVSDNAGLSEAGQSIARIIDGADTGNDKNDFAITTTPTNGTTNRIESPSNNSVSGNNTALPTQGSAGTAASFYDKIFISEFLSDPPVGAPEWIELYNNSGEAVSVANWYIEEGSEEKTVLSGQIPAHGYFLVNNPKGSLNNTGDIIFLYDAEGRLVDKVTYGKWNDGNTLDNAPVAFDGASTARKNFEHWGGDNDNFALTLRPTLSGSNAFVALASTEKNTSLPNLAVPVISASSSVVLNEILPNPLGADEENEFVELFNTGNASINLAGWKITSQNRKNYFFSATSSIAGGGFLVVYRKQSKMTLRNTAGDFVELYDAENRLVDKAIYEDKAEDNFAYARFSTTSLWKWTKTATPGRANILVEANFPPEVFAVVPASALAGEEIEMDAADTFDEEGDDLHFVWDLGNGIKMEGENITTVYEKAGNYKIVLSVSDGHNPPIEKKMKISVIGEDGVSAASITSAGKSSRGKQTVVADIADIKNLAVGDIIKTQGVVTVLPGIFGTQIFYIADPVSGAGIPVYMFKKDFPNLVEGSKVVVTGELTIAGGAPRLKTKIKNDIQVFSVIEKIAPKDFAIDEIDNSFVGSLGKISGEVVQVSSDNFYIADETGEILVQIKKNTGLKSRDVREKDKVIIAGIIGQNKDGPQIWPRNKDDIQITALGTGSATSGKETAENTLKDEYFTATAGGFTSLILAFLMRSRAALAKNLTVGAISKVVFWKKNKMG